MRRLYKNIQEGIGLSKNASRAWDRGERPEWFWDATDDIEPTAKHHIEIGAGLRGVNRPLVMFFRRREK